MPVVHEESVSQGKRDDGNDMQRRLVSRRLLPPCMTIAVHHGNLPSASLRAFQPPLETDTTTIVTGQSRQVTDVYKETRREARENRRAKRPQILTHSLLQVERKYTERFSLLQRMRTRGSISIKH